MDTKPRWDYQRRNVEAGATNRLSAASALAFSTWGASSVRAMIVSQMLYRCYMWRIPGNGFTSGGSAIINDIQDV